jgi:nitroreductase
MNLDKAIQTRRSIRSFKDKKPNWRDIIEAIETTTYAPMAGNIFSLRFMVITDDKLIQRIAAWSEQDFIAQTEYLVLFITRQDVVTNTFGEKGKDYAKQQAGAAIQNFLLKITDLKLATCWIGHFNEKRIKEMLQIPEDRIIEAIFPIGYSKEKLKPKNKKELFDKIFFNKWNHKTMQKENIIEGRSPEGI